MPKPIRCPVFAVCLTAVLTLAAPGSAGAADDVRFADFENGTYGDWKVEGTAFGSRPATGALPGQMNVEGFSGKGLANSFHGGDDARGRLTSPAFTIRHAWISFLIGGGGFAGQTCLDLVVDGVTVRTATGPNTLPGGSERLAAGGWDVRDLAGRIASFVVVDKATGGWGHINVDHIVLTDTKPPGLTAPARREITATHRWLRFPVKNGAPKRTVTVSLGGRIERAFEIELADAEPDWQAPLDISMWRGKSLVLEVDALPDGSGVFEAIVQSDDDASGDVYREALRPGFHFSAKRGWHNDPNGLVEHNGRFHLFFQHNPYGVNWGNMHWGHATSRDLVHWDEDGAALYPDATGTMFSGSGVVVWDASSMFPVPGAGQGPAMVLFYTAAGGTGLQSRGRKFTQCLAYSHDEGKTWRKYHGNPVIEEITGGNRDPKVIWHAPTRQWVMVLYVEKDKTHMVAFLTSPNLRDWTFRSEIAGFFECPDLFPLPGAEPDAEPQWVLTAANSEYMLGSFDGATFTPQSAILPGHRGKGFYAAQTFADMPDFRRVQIGWLQAPSPGMPFNQCMSLPCELSLIETPDGPRLARQPVRELERLRARSHDASGLELNPGDANPLEPMAGELIEVRADFSPDPKAVVVFKVRGVPVEFDAATQHIIVNGHRAPAPLRNGRQRLAIFLDRTVIEVFASDGLIHVPLPVIPDRAQRSVGVTVRGGGVRFASLAAHELESIWKR